MSIWGWLIALVIGGVVACFLWAGWMMARAG
jgi:hypothetical protein